MLQTWIMNLYLTPIRTEVVANRSNEIRVTPNQATTIGNIIALEGRLPVSHLISQVGNIGGSSIEPRSVSRIHNGWDQERFMFILITETADSNTGEERRSVISGYTDTNQAHIIPTRRGQSQISPDMLFIPNNISESIKRLNHQSGKEEWVQDKTYNVHRNITNTPAYEDQDLEYLAREEDVFSTLNTSQSGYEEAQELYGSVTSYPIASTHDGRGTMSQMSNLLTATKVASDNNTASYDRVENTLSSAKGKVMSPKVDNNPFIALIQEMDNRRIKGDSYLRVEFTLGDLEYINGSDLGDKLVTPTDVFEEDMMSRDGLHPTEATTIENKIAYDLLDILTTQSWSMDIAKLVFSITNTSSLRSGSPMVHIERCSTMLTGDTSRAVRNNMEIFLGEELFPQLEERGHSLSISADLSLMNISYINVTIDSRRPQTIKLPSIADALFNSHRTDHDGMIDSHNGYMELINNTI